MKRGPTVPPAVRRGPVGSRRGPESPWGRRGMPRGSVHKLCTDTGQSSDPSSPVGSCRAKTEVLFGFVVVSCVENRVAYDANNVPPLTPKM